jgi:hypothetical protein
MSDDELLELYRQQQSLMFQKFQDIRHDLRSAVGRMSALKNYPALTVGDNASLIGWSRTLKHMEDEIERLQVERGKRDSL